MSFKRLLCVLLVAILLFADVALANQYYAKTTTSATVYSKASTSSSKVGTISSGSWVFISEAHDGWVKVTNGSKTGFVSAGSVKRTAKALYVSSGTAVLYKTASTSGTKLKALGYGTKLDGWYKDGDWTNVTLGNTMGWIKNSCLTTTNPNTQSQACYVQAKSGKVYALPDTSSSSTEVSGTTKLTCTAIYNGTWCRVTWGSKTGYIKKSALGSSKYTGSSSSSSSSSSSASSSSVKSSSSSSAKSTSAVTPTTKYVSAGSMGIYKSNSTSSTKLGFAVYGAKVTVGETRDGWSQVSYGSIKGFCKSSCLSGSNPNTMSQIVYAKSSSVKAYEKPDTSSNSIKVSTSTAFTCTAVYNSTWCRVTSGGRVAFIKKSDLTTSKPGSSTSSPASAKSVSVDWFKGNIQSVFYRGCIATVTDVATGISWKVKRRGGTSHADCEPLTAADVAAMKKACGSDFMTWHRRAIWVSINGKKYAASMNCMAHGNYAITDNGFDGHHCIHFTNSKTHGGDRVDPDHQAAIKRALAAG